MARTGRYTHCPAAGKIHRNAPTLLERFRRWKYRREHTPDMRMVIDYWPAYYPAGYKK